MVASKHEYWASDSTYEIEWDRARELHDSGRFSDALILYRGLMANGVNADIYYETGCCYYGLKDFERAIIFFEKSLQLNDRRWSCLTKLADCYYNQNDFSKAIYNATRARTLKPDDLQEILELAKYYSANNMNFESMYFYNKYLQTAPDKRNETYREINKKLSDARSSSSKYASLGYNSFNRKEFTPARTAYLQALQLYPISYDTNYNLALANRDLNNHKEAIAYFMQSLFLNPQNTKTFMHIASEYSKLRDYTRAYCFVKRYLNSIMNQNQAEYLNTMKNLKALEPHINKDFSPNVQTFIAKNQYLFAYYELENATLVSDNKDNSIAFNNIELMVFPEKSLSTMYNKKGTELYNSGKIKDANKYFTRVMEISSKDSAEYKFAKARLSYV